MASKPEAAEDDELEVTVSGARAERSFHDMCSFTAATMERLEKVHTFVSKLRAAELEHGKSLLKVYRHFEPETGARPSVVPRFAGDHNPDSLLKRMKSGKSAKWPLLSRPLAEAETAEGRRPPFDASRPTTQEADGDDDGLQLSSLWLSVLDEARARATQHELLAGRLGSEIVVPLEQKRRDLEAKRKALVSTGEQGLRQLHELHSRMRSTQSQYLKDKKAADEAAEKLARLEQTPGVKEKELLRSRERNAALADASAARGRSLEALKEECTANQEHLYGALLPSVIDGFYDFEAVRADCELAALASLQSLRRKGTEDEVERMSALEALIQQTNPTAEAELEKYRSQEAPRAHASKAGAGVSAMSLLKPACSGRLLFGQQQRGKPLYATRLTQRLCVLMPTRPSETVAAGPCPTLYIFAAEDSDEPLAVLPLPTADRAGEAVRCAHESIFNMPQCIEVQVHAQQPAILHCLDEAEYGQWVLALRALVEPGTRSFALSQPAHAANLPAFSRLPSPSTTLSDNSSRLLDIAVLDANTLPRASEYAVHIYLDAQLFARTQTVRGGPAEQPDWSAHFVLEDIPFRYTQLHIALVEKVSASTLLRREVLKELGQVSFSLREMDEKGKSLDAADEPEQWHPLLSVKPRTNVSFVSLEAPLEEPSPRADPPAEEGLAAAEGSGQPTGAKLRLRMHMYELIDRPPGMYTPLLSALAESSSCACALLDACSVAQREGVIEGMLYGYNSCSILPQQLDELVRREVDVAGSDDTLLFRSNSSVTKLLDVYCRISLPGYRRQVLRGVVQAACKLKAHPEVDPARCADPAELKKNMKTIASQAQGMWDVVLRACSPDGSSPCPPPLRLLLAICRRAVASRFGKEHSACAKAVGGIFFLRYMCPALQMPHKHGVTHDAPSQSATRTLTLLSKALVNLANQMEFGKKEPHLAELNELFIRPNLASAQALMLSLSDDELQDPLPSTQVALPPVDVSRKLALVHASFRRKLGSASDRAAQLGCVEALEKVRTALAEVESGGSEPLRAQLQGGGESASCSAGRRASQETFGGRTLRVNDSSEEGAKQGPPSFSWMPPAPSPAFKAFTTTVDAPLPVRKAAPRAVPPNVSLEGVEQWASGQGKLHVELQRGSGLKPMDRNGLSDPYVKLSLAGQQHRSKTIKKTLNPQWDECFTFSGSLRELTNTPLKLSAFDWDMALQHDKLGEATVNLSNLLMMFLDQAALAREWQYEYEAPLQLPNGQMYGRLHLRVAWVPDTLPPAIALGGAPAAAPGAHGAGESSEPLEPRPPLLTQHAASTLATSGKEPTSAKEPASAKEPTSAEESASGKDPVSIKQREIPPPIPSATLPPRPPPVPLPETPLPAPPSAPLASPRLAEESASGQEPASGKDPISMKQRDIPPPIPSATLPPRPPPVPLPETPLPAPPSAPLASPRLAEESASGQEPASGKDPISMKQRDIPPPIPSATLPPRPPPVPLPEAPLPVPPSAPLASPRTPPPIPPRPALPSTSAAPPVPPALPPATSPLSPPAVPTSHVRALDLSASAPAEPDSPTQIRQGTGSRRLADGERTSTSHQLFTGGI